MDDNDFYLMKKYIPKEHWEDLMFMGYSNNIALYKHFMTRMYINVDTEGNFYQSNGRNYYIIDREYALGYVIS